MSASGDGPGSAIDLGVELPRKAAHVAFGAFALTLRWLAPWQAVLLSAAALAFNLWLLHPLTRGRLLRPGEREAGFSRGVALYPAAVLALVVVLGKRLELAAAAWGLIAFGDGMAALVGALAGGPRLPWHPRKTWAGLLAFTLWGTAAAAFLIRWTQQGMLDAVAPGASGAAARVGASFLAVSAADRTISDAAWLLLGCLVAAAAAALAESWDTGFDDNVVVALVGGAALWLATLVEPGRVAAELHGMAWGALVGAAATALPAVGALALGGVDRGGALAGWLLASTLWACAGWRGVLPLALLFLLGTAATLAGGRRKRALGVAQANRGRRGARHALANALVGTLAGVLVLVTPHGGWFTLAMVAAFATATADTAASEIGQAWGRRPRRLTDLRPVATGTEGAVTARGTAAGLAAAALVAAAAVAAGTIEAGSAPAVVGGAAVGSLAESWIAGFAASRGRRADGDALNLANTAVGALAACALAAAIG